MKILPFAIRKEICIYSKENWQFNDTIQLIWNSFYSVRYHRYYFAKIHFFRRYAKVLKIIFSIGSRIYFLRL